MDGCTNVFRTFYVMVYGLYEDKGDGGEVSGRRGLLQSSEMTSCV